MFNQRKVDIAVLGAGPVGLIAAHALADKGVDFLLLDREAGSNIHSYALVLHPDTLELFDSLNIVEPILKHAKRVSRIAIYDEEQRQRAAVNYGEMDLKYPFLAVIPQNLLETLLIRTLKQKGHQPKWAHRVRCIQQTEDIVQFTVDRLMEGSTGYAVSHVEPEIDKIFEYTANYVIAADGYRSMAREAAKIEFPEISHGVDYALFELETNVKILNEMRLIVDGDKTHIYCPLGEGRCRFSFQVDPIADQSQKKVGQHNQIYQITRNVPELENTNLNDLLQRHAPWFIGSSDHVVWRAVVHFEKHLANAFGRGRIWLTGDAAHMAYPAGVLSMNLGMREAADLSNRLSAYLDDPLCKYSLQAYDAERRGEWKRTLDQEHKIQSSDATGAWLLEHRDSLLANLPASGKSLDAVLKQLHLTTAA